MRWGGPWVWWRARGLGGVTSCQAAALEDVGERLEAPLAALALGAQLRPWGAGLGPGMQHPWAQGSRLFPGDRAGLSPWTEQGLAPSYCPKLGTRPQWLDCHGGGTRRDGGSEQQDVTRSWLREDRDLTSAGQWRVMERDLLQAVLAPKGSRVQATGWQSPASGWSDCGLSGHPAEPPPSPWSSGRTWSPQHLT